MADLRSKPFRRIPMNVLLEAAAQLRRQADDLCGLANGVKIAPQSFDIQEAATRLRALSGENAFTIGVTFNFYDSGETASPDWQVYAAASPNEKFFNAHTLDEAMRQAIATLTVKEDPVPIPADEAVRSALGALEPLSPAPF
jgi:hypothetical protein